MIVSVDDHVIEPPHVWETWLPARYRDRGPKVVRDGSTVEWIQGNQVLPRQRGRAAPARALTTRCVSPTPAR
jgi:hypothetical protein